MAARASMTDEAPVAFLKTSMSPWLFTRSREPPLQEAHGGKTHHITCCGWNQGPGTWDLERSSPTPGSSGFKGQT